MRSTGFVLIAVIFALVAGNAEGQRPSPDVRTITLTRTVKIPFSTASEKQLDGGTAKLPVTPGAEDEPPIGPNAFDVLDDGSFLIGDPLTEQISVFDAQGRFQRAWKIGFSPDSVTALPDGVMIVREATTGELHTFNREGQAQPGREEALPEAAQAHLLSGKGGTISRGAGGAVIDVKFDKPGYTLLSLQPLAVDRDGASYVALESSNAEASSEGIDVNKTVRKYAADGKLVSETSPLPLGYYITPVDELRVHKGVVYQLMTTSSEVQINVWDTN